MKLNTALASFLLATTALASGQSPTLGRGELAFQPNLGQAPAGVDFVARGREYALSLSRERATLGTAIAECGELSIAMELVGALPGAAGEPADPRAARFAYFHGNDPAQWQSDVPSFGTVRYDGVWPGVDVAYLGVEGRFRYDFHVRPQADPSAIRLRFDGVEHVEVLADGSLALDTSFGRVVQPAPTVYQVRGDEHEPVRGGYALVGERTLGFALDAWDRERELVIDPTVVWQTLIGSPGVDRVDALRRAPNGNLWLVGETDSANYPRAGFGNPFVFNGANDVFVSEFDPSGATLLFSALVGGAGDDYPNDAALVGDGDIVVCGRTVSNNFPALTSSKTAPFQSTLLGPQDAFVFRLNDGGSFVFSTYLGGTGYDEAVGVGVVAGDSVVVAGDTSSSDFPVQNPAQAAHVGPPGTTDGFVTQLAATGDALDWSTYWGTPINDHLYALAVDTADDSVVVGGIAGASVGHVFAQRFLADGSATDGLLFGDSSTYNSVRSIAIAANSSVAFAIETFDPSFTTVDPLPGQDQGQGGYDTVVAVWDATLTTLQFASYLSGPDSDQPAELATRDGRVYVLLDTESTQLPQIDSMSGTPPAETNGYVACIDLGITPPVLEWASYLPAGSDCYPASLALDPTPGGPLYVSGELLGSPLDVLPSTIFGSGASTGGPFVTRVDPGLASGASTVGFGAVPGSVISATNVTVSVFRWGGTDTAIDVPYTVDSSGQPLTGLAGSVHFDAGEQLTQLSLNWAGVTIPTMYLAVTLAPDLPTVVDPNRATAAFMVGSKPPPPPPPRDTGSSSNNSCCSVATVTNGTPMSHDLDLMRAIRDRLLSRFGAGRDFTSWYYRNFSPTAVRFMRAHPASLPIARALLWMLLLGLKYPVEIAGVALVIAMLRWHRRLARTRTTLALAPAR